MSEVAKSISFEKLKRELQEKDEVIGILKKKLQVMESFHCSSSSLDALNSFQCKGNNNNNRLYSSSIFLLPDDDPQPSAITDFPSPKFRPLDAVNSKASTPRKRHHTDTGMWPLASPQPASETIIRRASLFENLSRLRMPSFLNTPKLKRDGIMTRLLRKLKEILRKKKKPQTKNLTECESSPLPSTGQVSFEISYERIISGQFPGDATSLNKIEEYLKWDDCIDLLGVTKDQLQWMRTESLEFRKRRVFLCADQLQHYPKLSQCSFEDLML